MRGRAKQPLWARLCAWLKRCAIPVNLAIVLAILALAGQVPPDGSLSQIRARGVLRVCIPMQGLTAEEAAPVEALARAIPARLSLEPLTGIGSDSNPRNWRLTRAQCDVIAGGLADTEIGRSFLSLVAIGTQTGWAVWPDPVSDCKQAYVWPGASGLSRVMLSQYLRENNIRASLAPNLAEIWRNRAEDPSKCIIASLPEVRRLTENADAPLPKLLDMPGYPPVDLALGFGKGDATLVRAARKIVVN